MMNVLRLHKVDPEPVTFSAPPSVDDAPAADFDLRALVRVFLVRRWTILGAIVLCMTIAGIVVMQLTPVYSASTLIMVGQRENKVLDPEALIAGLNTDAATMENQIQVLRSWTLAERVVVKLNLTRDPEFNARSAKRSLLSRLNPLNWFGTGDANVRLGTAVKTTVDPAIIKRFGSKLTVAAVGRSSVIRLTFESADRQKAATIVDAVADQYIVDQLESKFEAARRTSDWLNERLGQLAEQVRKAESAVEQYKEENDISSGRDGGNLATEQVSEINAQIVLARSQLAEQDAKYRQVEKLYR
ncbi:MAG: GumC family protein, partial [Micropepsaceae bacterium]